MTISGGVVLQARTVRIACDLVDKETGDALYDGLWADVRRNLTHGERDALKEDAAALDARGEALTKDYQEREAVIQAAFKESEDDVARRVDLIAELNDLVDVYIAGTEQVAKDRFTLIAPHVHGWNLQTLDENGEIVAAPSPRENPDEAFRHIDTQIVGWLLGALLGAYRRGFQIGSRKSGAQQEPTQEPSAEKPKGSGSRSRRSRETSSSPNPSTSAA